VQTRIENDVVSVARRDPARIAIEEGSRRVSFGQLDRLAGEWAATIRAAGIGPGDPVWLVLANSTHFVIGVLAILKAQAVAVPVNPRLAAHELNRLAAVSPPTAVLAPAVHSASTCPLPIKEREARVRLPVCESDVEMYLTTSRGSGMAVGSDKGEPGVVFFTSGSTGRPKAILLTHENICSATRAAALAFGVDPEDRTLVCMQMCHSFTFTKQMLSHLRCGATLVLAPDFFDAMTVLDLIDRQDCTTLFAVPSMHIMLLEHIRRGRRTLPTLRMLVSGGAPIPESVQLGLADALPHAEFVSSYGLSEASPFVSSLPGKRLRDKLGSVGWPAAGVEVLVLDKHGRSCLPRIIGEVCVQGRNVMAGYLSNPEATAQALVDGTLHTGDMGWLDEDGCLYLCGRMDDMILRGAENVYPVEIESVLASHEAVADAAVIGKPHPVLGNQIAAYVQPKPHVAVDVSALRRLCRERLAAFKVPRSIHVVSDLPRTPNGKILRRALRELDVPPERTCPTKGSQTEESRQCEPS